MDNKDLNQAIWDVLISRINHLTWKCGECDKMEECEDHAPTNPVFINSLYFEPRFCKTLLKAAIFGEQTFPKPFIKEQD